MDESNQKPTGADTSSPVASRGALAAARRWMSSRWAAAACAALLAVMSLQMLAVVWRKSITTDEIVMIPAAYYYLVAGDCRLVNEHPPFVKLVAALPLLFVQPKEAPPAVSLTDDSALVKFEYADSFWDSNNDIFESLSFWRRGVRHEILDARRRARPVRSLPRDALARAAARAQPQNFKRARWSRRARGAPLHTRGLLLRPPTARRGRPFVD